MQRSLFLNTNWFAARAAFNSCLARSWSCKFPKMLMRGGAAVSGIFSGESSGGVLWNTFLMANLWSDVDVEVSVVQLLALAGVDAVVLGLFCVGVFAVAFVASSLVWITGGDGVVGVEIVVLVVEAVVLAVGLAPAVVPFAAGVGP